MPSAHFCIMSKRTSNMAKRKQAKDLYCRYGMLQKIIAETLNVTEKTISKWKVADQWELHRAAFTTTRDHELRRLYAQVADLNNAIELKNTGERHADSKQADILGKLASAIRAMETDAGVADTIDVSIKFLEWLKGRKVVVANLVDGKQSLHQLVTEEMDAYIKGLLR